MQRAISVRSVLYEIRTVIILIWIAHAHAFFFGVPCTTMHRMLKNTIVYETDLAQHFLQHKQHQTHDGTCT